MRSIKLNLRFFLSKAAKNKKTIEQIISSLELS